MIKMMSSTEDSKRPTVKRCWIHIGMHKTGTTSVQMNLAKVKRPADWRYLKIGGRANMGKSLCAMFARNPLKHSAFAKLGISLEEVAAEGAKLRKKLRKTIQRTKKETIIISAEALSSAIDRDGIAALKEFLEPLCEEIRVIGYVRPPMGFKTSIFQEAVKHGKSSFNIVEAKIHYRRRFKKFDDVFGRENVILRKFDPASFPHHCIVADFCEQIGIEAPDRASIVRTNESLSREACGILYAYRKFGPGYGVGDDVIKENTRMIAPLFSVKGTKFKVSQELMARGIAAEIKDIRWMKKRLGQPLRESIKDDGTEVTSEDDLLRIKRSSCEQYARHFEAIHGIRIASDKIPSGDPVDPRQAAEFVQHCRDLCRKKILRTRAIRNIFKLKFCRLPARWLRNLKKLIKPPVSPKQAVSGAPD